MIYLEFQKKIDLVVINYVCKIKSVTAIINQFGKQTRILHLIQLTRPTSFLPSIVNLFL